MAAKHTDSESPTAETAATTELGARLRLVVARLNRRLRQEADIGITPSQLAALSTIERHGPITLGDLAAYEQVRPPTMTKIVGGLEEPALVQRTVDPADRRVARMTITPEGRRLLARSRSKRNQLVASLLDELEHDERAVVERVVPILERWIDEPQ